MVGRVVLEVRVRDAWEQKFDARLAQLGERPNTACSCYVIYVKPQKQYQVSKVPYQGKVIELECPVHERFAFVFEDRGQRYRCRGCNTDSIYARKQRVKAKLVDQAGGGCTRCGYNKSLAALQFHHVDPTSKLFDLAKMTSKAEALVMAEAEKCILLCANCHCEVEEEQRGPVAQRERSSLTTKRS